MGRLRYSAGGLLRSIQMSRSRVHVFVEGRELDTYVYGKVLSHECPRPFEYSLKRADQVPGASGGGKPELKKLHDWLRRKGALLGDFKGHRFACLVVMDKDVDDILRAKKRSAHAIYTPTYDLEGHVYRHGDLQEAIAATLFIASATVPTSYRDATRWTDSAMSLWHEWVRLCVAAKMMQSRGVCNFGVASRVNTGTCGPVDMVEVAKYEAEILAASSKPAAAASSAAHSARRQVETRFMTGRAAEVFKGKWFGDIIAHELDVVFPVEFRRVAGFKSRILGHLAQSLRPGEAWAEPFAQPIRALVATL